jgi:ABC-type bacteriocin/lantibiotic exporter with double-glycine peptidase domain
MADIDAYLVILPAAIIIVFIGINGSQAVNLKAEALKGSMDELLVSLSNKEFAYPFIARVITLENYEHYVVVDNVRGAFFHIADPDKGMTRMPIEDFKHIWTGHVVVFQKAAGFATRNERIGSHRKLAGLIMSQKARLAAMFLLSIAISAIALASTFIFQLIIDEGLDGFEGFSGWLILHVNEAFAVVLVTYAIALCLQVVRGHVLARFIEHIDTSLMYGYIARLVDLPASFLAQ